MPLLPRLGREQGAELAREEAVEEAGAFLPALDFGDLMEIKLAAEAALEEALGVDEIDLGLGQFALATGGRRGVCGGEQGGHLRGGELGLEVGQFRRGGGGKFFQGFALGVAEVQ